MAIQQNVNQILSLTSMFATLGPGGEIAREKMRTKADVKLSKKKIDILEEKHKEAFEQGQEDALGSLATSKLEEQKKLYELDPTPELAEDITKTETRQKKYEELSQATKARRAAEQTRIEEMKRLEADRAREARLKILEGVPEPITTKKEGGR